MQVPELNNADMIGKISANIARKKEEHVKEVSRIFQLDEVMKKEVQVTGEVYSVALELLSGLSDDQRFTEEQVNLFYSDFPKNLEEVKQGELESHKIVLASRDAIPIGGRIVPLTKELRNRLQNEYEDVLSKTIEDLAKTVNISSGMEIGDFKVRLQNQINGEIQIFSSFQDLNIERVEKDNRIQGEVRKLNALRASLFDPPTTDKYSASQNGDLEWLQREYGKLWIDRGAKFFNTPNPEGFVPLHYAAYHGREDVVRFLLNKGKADPNKRDANGYTPIHWAAKAGNISCVRVLLAKGADINARGEFERTPLHMAVYNDRGEVTEYLLKNGANPDAQAEYEQTVLHYCVARKNFCMMQRIIGLKIKNRPLSLNLNLRDELFDTPLRLAVKMGLYQIVLLLLNDLRWETQAPTDTVDPNHIQQLLVLTPERDQQKIRAALINFGQ